MNRTRGFTIVELIVVIIIIAVLAVISIVSYNAVRFNSRTTAGKDIASEIASKARAFKVINARYPTFCELSTNTVGASDPPPCTAGAGATDTEAKLDDTSIISYASNTAGAGYTTTISNNNAVVGYYLCPTTGAGADVFYIDYTNNNAVTVMKIATGC